MHDDLKTAAEIWRRRLALRIATLREVERWADEHIALLDEPPYWLIAVSMAQRVEDAISALQEVKGNADTAEAWAAVMRDWLELLERHPERDSDIACALYRLGTDGDVPAPGVDAEMMSFWDAIDLARDGIHGVHEVERARLRSFLEKWSGTSTAVGTGVTNMGETAGGPCGERRF